MDAFDIDRLKDDLAGSIEGDLLVDELSRALYATDGSPFEVKPLAVVRPRHEADVQAVVRYAAEHGMPITARGAGTGTAGAALGPGLILDFSRSMHAILETGPDWIRVQPGVTWSELDRRLSTIGRRVLLEPAETTTSTIGGIFSTAAAGLHLARFGYPHGQVVSSRCVLESGDVVELSRDSDGMLVSGPDRFRRMHSAVVELLDRHATTIESEIRSTPFDRAGYSLRVRDGRQIDYPRLLSGSEGTLALVTELTLRTHVRPAGRSVALFGFATLDAALRVARRLVPRQPSACILIEARWLSIIRARTELFGKMIPSDFGAAVIVEFEAETMDESNRLLRDANREVESVGTLTGSFLAESQADAERLWRIVELAGPSLADLRGESPAVLGVEDIGVPTDLLAEFLLEMQEILQRHETTGVFSIDVCSGHVQLRPFLKLEIASDSAKLWSIAEDVNAVAIILGGTISVRHGTGIARTPWIARQHPRLLPIFRELKTIFDPRHLFNPGAIVGPDPSRPAWPMRGPVRPRTSTELLVWKPGDYLDQIAACNGCGSCRIDSAPERMCPIFRAGRTEEATPRAKANLLREVLRDAAADVRPSAARIREVADLCVNCKMCARECPAHVNIPKLMLETKAAHVAEHGLDRGEWVMSRLRTFSAIGSAGSLLANRLLRGPIPRWFLEKFFGLSRRRRLTPFAPRSFLRQAKRLGWTKIDRMPTSTNGDPRVALFVDIFSNYYDPTIAEAAFRVLEHNGIPVFVPPEQTSSGMEALSQGDLETARELAQRNVRVLTPLVRDGFVIICPEPTAALALTHDYQDLLDDPDAILVANHTVELTAFLADRHVRGRLRTEFQELAISLGHHTPCHYRALGSPTASPSLLRLIPGLRVAEIDAGCSGMAGTYGLRVENYDTSIAAGEPLFRELRRPRVQFGATECGSCRAQMEQGAGKRTLHPVQYLALAYGLMPDLERRLAAPMGGMVAQ
jgi:FAD/FMN-containing dehydrogenase/Fe-S oxidoreductase